MSAAIRSEHLELDDLEWFIKLGKLIGLKQFGEGEEILHVVIDNQRCRHLEVAWASRIGPEICNPAASHASLMRNGSSNRETVWK